MKAFDLEKLERDKVKRKKHIENIGNFLSDLKEFISAKAQDIIDLGNSDCWDSCAGMGSLTSESNLEKSLYKLCGIEIEEDEEEEED